MPVPRTQATIGIRLLEILSHGYKDLSKLLELDWSSEVVEVKILSNASSDAVPKPKESP